MSKATDTDGRHWLQPSGNISPRMTPTKQPHARGVVWFQGSPRTEGHMPLIIGRRQLLAALGSAAAAWPLAARAQLRISLALLKVRSALSSLAAVTGFALGRKNGLRDELRMSRMGSRHVTWFPQGRERMDLGPKSEIPAKTTKSQAGAAIQSTQRSFELR